MDCFSMSMLQVAVNHREALAVGEMSQKTGVRPWAAAWGKFSQQEIDIGEMKGSRGSRGQVLSPEIDDHESTCQASFGTFWNCCVCVLICSFGRCPSVTSNCSEDANSEALRHLPTIFKQ